MISLSDARRPKATSTPSRKDIGTVVAKMLGSRFRKIRSTVGMSAPRATRLLVRREMGSSSRTKLKSIIPRAIGGRISATM